MFSAPTLHVITTELTVGMFSLSGICFLLIFIGKGPEVKDSVAHWALAGGLLATPLAILTGVNSAPGDGLDNPLLANKLLLSMSAVGLALGLLWSRITGGRQDGRLHPSIGMVSVGMILLTAGIGGEYVRGESLIFFLPKDIVLLFPVWVSVVIMAMGFTLIGLSLTKSKVTESH